MTTTKKTAGATVKSSNGGNGGNGSSAGRSSNSNSTYINNAQSYTASMVTKNKSAATDRVIESPNTPTECSRFDAKAVADRAYQIWRSEGCPEGRSMAHWLQAERELGLKR